MKGRGKTVIGMWKGMKTFGQGTFVQVKKKKIKDMTGGPYRRWEDTH